MPTSVARDSKRTLVAVAILLLAAADGVVGQAAPLSGPSPGGGRRARAQTRKASNLRAEQAAILDHPSRPPADRSRDAAEKPLEIYFRIGIRPGMAVADPWPEGGYHTHLLALTVGEKGSVFAVHAEVGEGARASEREAQEELRRRLDSGALGNVRLVSRASDLPAQGLDVLFVEGHGPDLTASPGLVSELMRSLKPGGLLGVLDPRSPGEPDAPLIRALSAGGLELLARSTVPVGVTAGGAGPGGGPAPHADHLLLVLRKTPAASREAGSPNP